MRMAEPSRRTRTSLQRGLPSTAQRAKQILPSRSIPPSQLPQSQIHQPRRRIQCLHSISTLSQSNRQPIGKRRSRSHLKLISKRRYQKRSLSVQEERDLRRKVNQLTPPGLQRKPVTTLWGVRGMCSRIVFRLKRCRKLEKRWWRRV